jgi:hypothetical protein
MYKYVDALQGHIRRAGFAYFVTQFQIVLLFVQRNLPSRLVLKKNISVEMGISDLALTC